MTVARPALQDVDMQSSPKTGWAAFQFPDFRNYGVGRLNAVFAQSMQNVAVGWFVFELSHSPFALGQETTESHNEAVLMAGSLGVSALV